MLISIQSWCFIYEITTKNYCYSMQFIHKDVSIGINNIPLLRIFFQMLLFQAVSHDHNERSGGSRQNTSLLVFSSKPLEPNCCVWFQARPFKNRRIRRLAVRARQRRDYHVTVIAGTP